MKQARFRPLNQIYKDLCSLLHNVALCLNNTDFTSTESAHTIKNVKAILSHFEYQAAIEEAILFTAVHDYEPGLVAILRDDYRGRMQCLHQLQEIIFVNEKREESLKSILFGSRLIRCFNEFMICCVQQMNDHEAMVNPVLWRYYSDEELEQIRVSIISAQPPLYKKKAVVAAGKSLLNFDIAYGTA